jgi:hypothetical protein
MSTQDTEDSRERENEDLIVVNDELLEHVVIKRLYREIIIIRDKYLCTMQNVESISILTMKISFVIIFNWKFYVQLFFYVRKNIIKYDIHKNTRDFVILHETHVYLNQVCIRDLNVKTMSVASIVFHIHSKKSLMSKIERDLVHQLIIDFDCSKIQQYDFSSKFIESYLILLYVFSFFRAFDMTSIRLLLNTNQQIVNVLNEFKTNLKFVRSDYESFYSKHSTQHFIQFDDYSDLNNRSFVKVLVSSILNIWSKYTIVYEFDCIMKHEVMIEHNKNVRESMFQIRVMNVLESRDKYYIEFLHKSNDLNCRLNTDDRLIINFELFKRLKKTNWQTLMIDALSCTSLNDVCVNMYRSRNLDTDVYSSQSINSFSFDIIDMNATFAQIQEHFDINVEMNVTFNDKTFRRQLIELQKLHKNESCRWWKKFLLDKITKVSTYVDIYANCSSETMKLLKIDHFNRVQFEALNYVRHLSNEVEIITDSIATSKTFFVVNVLQFFLLNVKSNRTNDKRRSRVLYCTSNNIATNDFARRLFERSQFDSRIKNAMIIRMHSIATKKVAIDVKNFENSSLSTIEVNTSDRDLSNKDLKTILNISQMSIVSIVFRTFHESQKRLYEVTNKRYVLWSMSLVI